MKERLKEAFYVVANIILLASMLAIPAFAFVAF